MKKLCRYLCLVILLGMLVGCQADHAKKVFSVQNPGNSLINYDPDRQIFFNSEAVFLDCYVGLSVSWFTMPIYSKNYIDTADISVTFPVDVPVGVEITQVQGIEGKTEFTASEGDLPENIMRFYVYAAYRGGELASMAEAKTVNNIHFGVHDPLRMEYESLAASDLPRFYVYNIRVDLSEVPAPPEKTNWTLEKMDITIQGQTYEAKLGRVRLYNLEDFQWRANWGSPREIGGVYEENVSELYSSGIVKLPPIRVIDHFERDYYHITAVWLIGEDSEVLDMELVIKDNAGRYRPADVHDCVDEGETAYLYVTLRNEHAEELLSSIQYQLVVETYGSDYLGYNGEPLEREAVNACKIYTFTSGTNTTHYENYAIIFDGVDMEPYYDYYFDNYQSWRKNYTY